MNMSPLITLALVALCASASCAAVLPLDRPGMGVRVEAGKYVVRGKTIEVRAAVELAVEPASRVAATNEPHVLGDEPPATWHLGTALKHTLGPVDKGTRMPFALDPDSVRVHADGKVYREGTDYFLDRDWGGMSRLPDGSIAAGQKVMVDYAAYLERVDVVQVSKEGAVSVKTGKPVPVCARAPRPDPGCAALANVYVPYRTAKIEAGNIYPMPEKDLTWRSFVKASGREHLANTLGLLKAGRRVTVVCWGDSVTAGGSASSPEKTYVELFRKRLAKAWPNAEINLINAGIGGSSTDSRRAGFEKEVLDLNPDLITVEFVNDLGLPAERIAANYAEFIGRARARNPNIEFIVITPASILPAWMGNFPVFIPAVRKAAADNRVALADASNIWENLRAVGIPYMTLNANAINHPDDLGHEFFAACLMRLMSR